MSEQKEIVLPRRTTPEDVIRLIEARARGRDLNQIRSLNFGEHNFDGTVTAAIAFGLLEPSTKDLTKEGRELVLSPKEDKARLLLKGMLRFEAYELLLEAIFDKGQLKETNLDWIQTWWSTHGYGNSQTNRDEGASSLARFIEFVGLGEYTQGRRGFATRIEWRPDAANQVRAAMSYRNERISNSESDGHYSDSGNNGNGKPATTDIQEEPPASPPNDRSSREQMRQKPPIEGNSLLSLNLGRGRVVELSLPPKVTSAEKKRLLALLDLMVNVEDDVSNSSGPVEE